MEKVTKEQQKAFEQKQTEMIYNGLKDHKVFTYPQELFDRLRPFSFGGFPVSVMLFINETCNGFCYDRAMLMQLALENCNVVYADIDSLRYKEDGNDPEHAFVETTDFGGNRTWVIDTSVGLIFDKKYYYEMENPKINKVFTKEQCMQNPEIKEILANDFEKDKYSLPMSMPLVEAALAKSRHIGSVIYRDNIQKELEYFKQAINYDKIQQEINEDIEMMKTNPAKLDEKFNIVRDEYGREISRGGIPNPYYKPMEEIQRENEYFESIKDDTAKLSEYFQALTEECYKEMMIENERISQIADKRLEEIAKNPTANYYETSTNQSANCTQETLSQEVCQ